MKRIARVGSLTVVLGLAMLLVLLMVSSLSAAAADGEVDLAVALVAPDHVAAGSTFVANVAFHNLGTEVAPDARLTATLPTDTQFITATDRWGAPLPPDVMTRDDAVEILRVFVLDGGLSMAFQRAFEEPDMWGLLLVDLARHAARAYARESEYTEEDALNRILEMFQAEIERPTDTGTTTPRGKGH